MEKITVTEALAEITIVTRRIQKKRDTILSYLYRQEALKDPLEKSGGSQVVLQQEFQSIADLENRIIWIRKAIQEANSTHKLKVMDVERSIAGWLVWKRDIYPFKQDLYQTMLKKIDQVRANAMYKSHTDGSKTLDFVVNVDEKKLVEDAEKLEEIYGQLDGKLSLANATIIIEIN